LSKVYVVDDSISVRKAIERLLSAEGLEVVGAARGQEAVNHLPQELPDLIICDLILPDLDGFEVCRFVKATPGLASTPVLLISGIVDEEVRRKASLVQADGVFKKPFVGDELKTVVHSYLNGRLVSTARHPEAAVVVDSSPLELLRELQELQFAMILDDAGQRVAELGRPPGNADITAMGIDQLVKFASTISHRLARGEMEGLVLETGRGCLLLRNLPGGGNLVVSLANTWALGKARYLLRRIAAGLRTG